MNIKTLHKLSKEYAEEGLYSGAFEQLSVTIYRQIDYANNVLLVESDESVDDEVLTVYSIYEEANRCLYWSNEFVGKFIESINPLPFLAKDFLAVCKTHLRGSKLFDKINFSQIDDVCSLSSPAYDDWTGEFFIKARGNKYVLLWDYRD